MSRWATPEIADLATRLTMLSGAVGPPAQEILARALAPVPDRPAELQQVTEAVISEAWRQLEQLDPEERYRRGDSATAPVAPPNGLNPDADDIPF